MRIVFSSAISDWAERNSSFDSGVLRVAYTGRNRNNSFISKETFERCIQSIYNCPIVCRYDRDSDEIGAHDMELVEDADGGLKIVNITQPVGVIPESAKYWWEEIEDDSGLHEYLCVEALIWKRQEAYQKIKDDGITSESMEISIKEGEMVDGVYVIKRFEFTAFCLLGTAEPCFESASLEIFSYDGFKEKLADMMQDLKETFSMAQSSQEVGIHPQNYSEGGEEVLEQKVALMAEFGLNADMLDFNIEDFTVEELREKFEAMKSETAPAQEPEQTQENFVLEGQVRDELMSVIESERVERGCDDWKYTVPKYWFVDYDKDLNEVYGESSDDFNIYGFSYSMDGDHAVIDWDSKKRMKVALVEYDEGEQGTPFGRMFSQIEEQYSAERSELAVKYQTASDTIASMENELGTLRQFKADTENAIAKNERDKVFAQFEDLVGVDAFEALRESCSEYSADELEEKCFAIRGRQGTPAKFSYEPKSPKLPVEKTNLKNEPYGGVFAEYGIAAPSQHN